MPDNLIAPLVNHLWQSMIAVMIAWVATHKLMKLRFAVFLMVIAGVCAAAQQPAGTPQPAPDSSTLTLKSVTRLTLEDVTVTDAKGSPVHGLTQSDFTVKEDGKPQTVRNFEEHGTEQPQACPLQLPPNVYSNCGAAAPSAVNILLFDDVTTIPIFILDGQPVASKALLLERQQALEYFKTMAPGTQVAILKQANGLRIVQGFTSDRNALAAAVNSLRPDPVPGTYMVPQSGAMTPDKNLLGKSDYNLKLIDPIVAEAPLMNNRSEMTVAALNAVASFVSGIKGRKNLIWFTWGIPWLTNYPRYSQISLIHDYSPQLNRTYGLLTAAQVAIYPVDPRGLDPNLALAGEESVRDIAQATGGIAYYDRNDLDLVIGEAIATGADYYALSYVPPLSKFDGKYHTIDVKVDRPGLQLHYREGYTSMDPAKPLASDAEHPVKKGPPPAISDFHAAMMFGKPEATELPIDVRVLPAEQGGTSPAVMGALSPKLKGKQLVRYEFTYEVPAGEITLAADSGSGKRTSSIEVVVAAYSADGTLLNSIAKTANFSIQADQVEEFMQKPSRLQVHLDLPLGKLFIRAGVLDIPTQKMGIVDIPETVAQQ